MNELNVSLILCSLAKPPEHIMKPFTEEQLFMTSNSYIASFISSSL
jgi:hypothetical protein